MDRDCSFDLRALLKNHNKKGYKSKPLHFESVASGVANRLVHNSKHRRSSRLTTFDSVRDLQYLSPCISPAPLTEPQRKNQHRKQQLEKWKEEKNKKKKEAAANKQKPFLMGIPHNPLNYVPPPPLPKVKFAQSRSGRVTRSQTARNNSKVNKQPEQESFAPKNAGFQAPHIKSLLEVPKLVLPIAKREKKTGAMSFKSQPTAIQTDVKQARSRVVTKGTVGNVQSKTHEIKTKGTVSRAVKQIPPKYVQSSSSSENEIPSKMYASASTDNNVTVNTLSSTSESNFNKMSNSFEIKIPPPRKVAKPKVRGNVAQNVKPKTRSKVARSQSPPKHVESSHSSEIEDSFKMQPSCSEINVTDNIISMSSENDANKMPSTSSIDLEKSIESSSRPGKTQRKSRKSAKSPVVKLKTPQKSKTPSKSIKSEMMQTTPKNLIPRSESNSEEKLRSPKSNGDLQLTPELISELSKKISPCVTMSRGKDNARKEMKKKMEEGLLDEDSSDLYIDHFRRELASEIKRMTEICNEWDKIFEQDALPDNVQELVLGAVGQARLLMSQKLMQFGALIERCARPEPGQALVTRADLHGFWDMVFMQVENVDMRFKKLDELKARNWIEEQAHVGQRRVKPAANPTARAAAKPKPGGPSRLKEMIAAARKAKQEGAQSHAVEENKTFCAGFFSVSSPVRTPRSSRTPGTPANNMLKAVLSNEAKKASTSKKSASFAMLRAAVLGKHVECDGVAPLPLTPELPTTSIVTPGRSILKQSRDNVTKSSSKKSIKIVLFDQPDSDAEDKTTTTVPDRTKKNIDPSDVREMDTASEETKVKLSVTVSPLDVERDSKKKDKENNKRRTRLSRQNAVEETKSVRKCRVTPKVVEERHTPRRSTRRTVLEERERNIV